MHESDPEGLHHEVIEIKRPTLAQKLRSIVEFIADNVCFPSAFVASSVVSINFYLNNGSIDKWVWPIIGAQAIVSASTFVYNSIRPIEEIFDY